MAVERIEDPNLKYKSSIYFYRGLAGVLCVAVLAVWVMYGLQKLALDIALYVSGGAFVLWLIVALIQRATDAKSGLRPEGGVKWDGDVGNPDDENPANDKSKP